MIIVSNHENQLCNRLFALSPVLAYCAEHNQSLMLLFFCSKYSSLFPDFHKNDNPQYPQMYYLCN